MPNGEISHGEAHEISPTSNIIRTAHLMSEQAHTSPLEFLSRYEESTRAKFPGTYDQMIESGAIPTIACAKNEEERIGALLRGLSLSTIPVQPFIIDNGSKDLTAEIAKRMGAVVLTEETPGLREALKTGFSYFLEHGYHGPILHTDADSVPVPSWAKTMVGFAEENFPDGGHAYGRIIHYDGPRKAFKNALLTTGHRTRNRWTEKKGGYGVHTRNGIVLTGDDNALLFQLSTLPNSSGNADEAIRYADSAAQKPFAVCRSPEATVLTSGRRQPTIRGAAKAAMLPRRTIVKSYTTRDSS